MPNIAKRTLKFTQGLGYGTLTTGAALGTLFLAAATWGLAITGVGIPLAFVTGVGTAGCGYGTVFFAKKTGHKFGRAFEEGKHHHDHNDQNINYGFTEVDVNSITGSNAANSLKNNKTSKSSSAKEDQLGNSSNPNAHKPLFSAPVTEKTQITLVMSDTAPTQDPINKTSMISPAA